MASRSKADLQVLHVIANKEAGRFPNDQLIGLRQLAGDVDAEWHEVRGDDPAQALIDFARSRDVTQIVVGSIARSRWQELLGGGSFVRKISRLAAPAAIDVHIIARRNPSLEPTEIAEAANESYATSTPMRSSDAPAYPYPNEVIEAPNAGRSAGKRWGGCPGVVLERRDPADEIL